MLRAEGTLHSNSWAASVAASCEGEKLVMWGVWAQKRSWAWTHPEDLGLARCKEHQRHCRQRRSCSFEILPVTMCLAPCTVLQQLALHPHLMQHHLEVQVCELELLVRCGVRHGVSVKSISILYCWCFQRHTYNTCTKRFVDVSADACKKAEHAWDWTHSTSSEGSPDRAVMAVTGCGTLFSRPVQVKVVCLSIWSCPALFIAIHFWLLGMFDRRSFLCCVHAKWNQLYAVMHRHVIHMRLWIACPPNDFLNSTSSEPCPIQSRNVWSEIVSRLCLRKVTSTACRHAKAHHAHEVMDCMSTKLISLN